MQLVEHGRGWFRMGPRSFGSKVAFGVPTVVLVLAIASGVVAGSGAHQSALTGGVAAAGSVPHPSARWAASMTYDARDGYTVLFGGSNGSRIFTDTWMFRAGTWTRL